ncbi:GNAT family N-acetyltransferase [Phytohabitans houttuyneae]|uniref:N-acetyltransferase n=1 Tax=Phytohabitans houttuyneae TaxID=1076126 RepID=A0A6V8K553_9ACTN|nr:GNAT family N-acetyltransferase [Phytohabitans houttuyneae]GFJ77521.1 N-acetyltransferase [Phytohabitans houttuyneae]
MPRIEIRPLTAADPVPIAQAFSALGWPGKTVDQYRRYLDDQTAKTRAVLVSLFEGRFAGYLTVRWSSDYTPFRAAGIPEVVDLNVLPQFRRRRIASTLMDAAEDLTVSRSDTAGIGVGLNADYAAAHLMYLRRGYLPDGRGVAYRGITVQPGAPVKVDDDLALMMTRRLR